MRKSIRCGFSFKKRILKMGGKNAFAGYNYYELADILPTINVLCDQIGLSNIISFGVDLATMTITNVEKPEEYVLVTSPMSTASLKGCHEGAESRCSGNIHQKVPVPDSI